jgi:pyruvate-formate lyase-activating enzyme
MLTGIHLLLSYTCNFDCDYCFVFSGPSAEGTFTIGQIQSALDKVRKIETVEWIHFEGGEPCLFYSLMLEGLKRTRAMGFQVGVITNAYFATTVEDARLWLQPLAKLGIGELSVSDDAYHWENVDDSPPKRVLACARDPACSCPHCASRSRGSNKLLSRVLETGLKTHWLWAGT